MKNCGKHVKAYPMVSEFNNKLIGKEFSFEPTEKQVFPEVTPSMVKALDILAKFAESLET